MLIIHGLIYVILCTYWRITDKKYILSAFLISCFPTVYIIPLNYTRTLWHMKYADIEYQDRLVHPQSMIWEVPCPLISQYIPILQTVSLLYKTARMQSGATELYKILEQTLGRSVFDTHKTFHRRNFKSLRFIAGCFSF